METTSNRNRLVALYLVLVITTIVGYLLYVFQSSFSIELYEQTMLYIVAINTVLYFWIRVLKYGEMRWLSITTIFIIGYFVVFYQIFFLNLFGFELIDVYFRFIWINQTVMHKTFSVASIGILAFYLGASSFKLKLREKLKCTNLSPSSNSIFFILTLAYIFYILFFILAGSYRFGVYYAKDASPLATYFYKIFVVCLSSAVIIKISYLTSLKGKVSFKQYIGNLGFPLLLLLIWHVVFSMYVGDRGPIISFTLLAFAMYFIRWQKLNVIRIIIAVFLVAFLLTFIGKIRALRSSGMGYSKRFTEVVSDYSDDDSIDSKFGVKIPMSESIELALSVQTLNYSLYNVPGNYNYRYGLYQLNYFFSIFPGLTGITNSLLYDGSVKYTSSADFVTYLVQGDTPSYGNGTSILADFYLDFGIIGVVVGLFYLGLFVGTNEQRLWNDYQKPTFVWIATLILLSKAIYLNRSSVGLEISNIVLIYLFIKLNETLVMYSRKLHLFKDSKK